jgi:hypothetical protein
MIRIPPVRLAVTLTALFALAGTAGAQDESTATQPAGQTQVQSMGTTQDASPFRFDTPERTWAVYKYAIDTLDKELFRACIDPESGDYRYIEQDFERFAENKGPAVSTSRAVSSRIDGDTATLIVDFFGKNRDGKVFHDNDPVKLVRRDGKWLLTGF